MKHFTFRQMFMIMALLFPLSRMILFPSSLAFVAGTSGIVSVAICMAFELCVVIAVVVVWKNTNLSYFDLISKAISPAVSKIVAVLYVLLFFAKLTMLLSSQKLMMFNVLYENVSQYLLFLPVVALLGYAGCKNSNSLARVFELSAGFVFIAFVGIMVLSAQSVNVANFFPPNFDGVLQGSYAYAIYFGDFTFFLMFFSQTRKDYSEFKILLSWVVNFAITMLFIFVFFGVFGKLAVGGTYATSNLSKYAVAFSQIGRYDFLFILIVGFGFIVLSLAIHHAMLSCGEFICGKRWVWSIAGAVALFVSVYFVSDNFEKSMRFVSSFISPFAIIMQFVLPILSPLLLLKKSVRAENSESGKSGKSGKSGARGKSIARERKSHVRKIDKSERGVKNEN